MRSKRNRINLQPLVMLPRLRLLLRQLLHRPLPHHRPLQQHHLSHTHHILHPHLPLYALPNPLPQVLLIARQLTGVPSR